MNSASPLWIKCARCLAAKCCGNVKSLELLCKIVNEIFQRIVMKCV